MVAWKIGLGNGNNKLTDLSAEPNKNNLTRLNPSPHGSAEMLPNRCSLVYS